LLVLRILCAPLAHLRIPLQLPRRREVKMMSREKGNRLQVSIEVRKT
jgi:hypothetical protein